MRKLALAAVFLSLPAAAEVRYPSGTISWSAPHECPGEAELVDEIERLLGQPLSVARQQELVLRAWVTGSPAEGYAVTLQVTSGAGSYERTLQHTDCGKLTEGAALVMALAIDPERVTAQGLEAFERPEPEPERPAESPAAAAPSPPTAQAPSDEPPAPLGGDFGVALLGGVGMLPEAGLGLGVDVGLRVGQWFRLGGDARYWFSSAEPVGADPSAEIQLDLWTAGLRACALVPATHSELSLCLGPEAGIMRGEGGGVDDPRRAADLWSALVLAAGAGAALAPPLLLVAGAEAGAVLVRPRYGIEGWDGQFQGEAWTVRARIGLMLRLN